MFKHIENEAKVIIKKDVSKFCIGKLHLYNIKLYKNQPHKPFIAIYIAGL